ncbi:MAG: hypothetical protein V2G33_04715 [bacterium JZ-2024 1]
MGSSVKFGSLFLFFLLLSFTFEADEIVLQKEGNDLKFSFPRGGTLRDAQWKLNAGKIILTVSPHAEILSLIFEKGFEFSLLGYTLKGDAGIMESNRISGKEATAYLNEWVLECAQWEADISTSSLTFSGAFLKSDTASFSAEKMEITGDLWKWVNPIFSLPEGKLKGESALRNPGEQKILLKNWSFSGSAGEMKGETVSLLLKEKILLIEGMFQVQWGE